MTFAIIESGGKQYKVSPGMKIKVEKLDAADGSSTPLTAGANFAFDKVLLVADGAKVSIGAPYVAGAKVVAKVLQQGRGDKKIVFKYHSKTRYRKFKGHRQPFTEVEISDMG